VHFGQAERGLKLAYRNFALNHNTSAAWMGLVSVMLSGGKTDDSRSVVDNDHRPPQLRNRNTPGAAIDAPRAGIRSGCSAAFRPVPAVQAADILGLVREAGVYAAHDDTAPLFSSGVRPLAFTVCCGAWRQPASSR
jgi:hypothetical protein